MARVTSLCVYCGSSGTVSPWFLSEAYALGRIIATAGMELVYGGGRIGLMGRLADGALESGGRVTGIIPRHLHDREVAHRGVANLIVVETMHERKTLMAERADAFVVLPGGFGTLDEMFEILTWRMLGLHDKPLILVNQEGYWDPLLALMDKIIAEGFASPASGARLMVVARAADVFPALDALPAALSATQSARF